MSNSETNRTEPANLGIKLNSDGQIAVVLRDGEELVLPVGDLEAVLMRVLLQRERNSRVGHDRAGTRFYMIHLQRHGEHSQEQCQWCQEERLADEVLIHPVTKLPMTAKSLRESKGPTPQGRVGEISESLAEELGL